MPLARTYLAVLLLAMALGQALSLRQFVDAIDSYRFGAAPLVAAILLAGELFAGIGLLLPLPRTRVVAGGIGLLVAALWGSLALQAAVRGLTIPNCGCFGAFFAQGLSWWILPQDLYFLGLAGLALRSAVRDSRTDPAVVLAG